MKKFILLALLAIPMLIHAQDKGIQFEHEASWKEVQAKANAENKYIFMDCFTTWCGPCKYMSASIFPLKEVGSFMNDKFVSIKVQLDTTARDDEFVKSWYRDAHDLAFKYNVIVYPTYLIFDSDGHIVHRFVGSSPADEFMAKVKKSLNPETQYYTLVNQYKKGKRSGEFLRRIATASAEAYDMENAMKVADQYLGTQTDLFTKDNLDFIKRFTQSSSDKGFEIMVKNPQRVDAALGKGSTSSVVLPIIIREEIFKYFPQNPKATPDWGKINAAIVKKYPVYSSEAMAKAKVMWYQQSGDWKNYQVAVVKYMNEYGATVSPEELNSYAWTVFQNCPDMKCVAEALEWSKRSITSCPLKIQVIHNW